MRREGGSGNKQWRLNCDCERLCCLCVFCVCVCTSVPACTGMDVSAASQGHSFWGASIIRAVTLDPHLTYETVLWRQTPIHTVAPPAHLDKPAWSFIISLVIPELPASDFYLHNAQGMGIHISNLKCFWLCNELSVREWMGGWWWWWWWRRGVQGGRESAAVYFLNPELGQIVFTCSVHFLHWVVLGRMGFLLHWEFRHFVFSDRKWHNLNLKTSADWFYATWNPSGVCLFGICSRLICNGFFQYQYWYYSFEKYSL